MANTDTSRDIAALRPMEYAVLMIRVALGLLYLSHSLVMWTLFGFDHAAHYFISVALPASTAYVLAAGEFLGAVMLLTGLCIRPVAVALLPIAIGTGLVHFGTGVGAGWGYSAYLACCLIGQALLASGLLTEEAGTDESPMLEDLSRSPKAVTT